MNGSSRRSIATRPIKRRLVIGVARLKRIEPKTSNPDLYSKIGLDDPSSKDANAVQCGFENADGHALAEVIVGNSRFGPPGFRSLAMRLSIDSPLAKDELPLPLILAEVRHMLSPDW